MNKQQSNEIRIDKCGIDSNTFGLKKLKKTAFEVYNQETTFISLDKAFEYVGDNSRYQKRAIFILSIQWIFYAFLTLGMPFLFQAPKFQCKTIENGKTIIFDCSEKTYCHKNYEKVFVDDKNSIAREFDLLCDKKYLMAVSQSLFFIGTCFSGLTFPHIADNFGRKKSMVFSLLSGGILVFASGFSPDITVLMVLMFFSGLCLSGYETITLVYVTEISAQRFRNFSGSILLSVWAASQILFVPVGYQVNDWRQICSYAIGLPIILSTFLTIYCLDETPRYLVSVRKYDQARQVLDKICQYNIRPPFQFKLYEEMEYENQKVTSYQQHYNEISQEKTNNPFDKAFRQMKEQTHGYISLLRYGTFVKRTFLLLYIWFMRYFVYFGIQFSLESFGSLHMSLLFTASAETIAAIIGAPIKLKLKRKTSFYISLIILVLSSLTIIIIKIPENCYYANTPYCPEEILLIFLAAMSKFSITLFIVILITYTSEVYPTNVRTKAYGLLMTVGKMGSIIVPYYVSAMMIDDINPLVIFGCLGMLGIIFVKFLPETAQKQMFDFVEEDIQEKEDKKEKLLKEIEMSKIKFVPGYD